MEYCKGRITKLLVDFFKDDFRRINHALEVLRVSEEIKSKYKNYDDELIIACGLLHDVGIKPSEEELGYNDGKTQELYGPAIVEELLHSIGFPEEKIKKCSEIVGNHHSPSRFDYIELTILKEADREINRLGL